MLRLFETLALTGADAVYRRILGYYYNLIQPNILTRFHRFPDAMVSNRPPITIRKLDLAGNVTIAYSGKIVLRTANAVVVEAYFTRSDKLNLGYATFERGDRFVEYFFADRWYNVFEVHAAGDDHLRGWYCNVTRPAVIGDGTVSAVDLALDVFVYPDGRVLVLDEDEFAELPIDEAERKAALRAVEELRVLVGERTEIFEILARQDTSINVILVPVQIDSIMCPAHIEEKIESKHSVTCREARQVLVNNPRIRFGEKGHTQGDDVYAAFGQTFGGRYLSVFFIYKRAPKTAIVISARAKTDRERKSYGRK